MSKVTSDMSMSLDGFIAGPNDGIEGVERLHQWLYGLEGWREPHGMAGVWRIGTLKWLRSRSNLPVRL